MQHHLAAGVHRHVDSRRLMLVGAASLTLGALCTPAASHVALLFALRVVQAVGYVAFTTAGTALVMSLVGPTERARRLAIFGAAANLAISLTPAAIAALLEVAPVAVGLLAAAAALAALGGLLSLLLPAAPPPPTRPSFSGTRWSFPRRLWLPMLTTGLLGAGSSASRCSWAAWQRCTGRPRRLRLPFCRSRHF